jgi:flagellar assembly protein FliH
MDLSDKVIKAKNVKMIEDPVLPAGRLPRNISGMKSGGILPKAAVLFSRGGGERKLEEKIAEAKKEAHAKGFSEGAESRKKEFLAALNAMAGVTREIGEVKKKIFAEVEEQMLGLACSIAEKVIHTEVSANKEIVLAVLREAVKSVVDHEGMKIRLNPDDLRFITEMKPDFLRGISGLKNTTFQEDASIKRGGVILETISGEVDARLEQQLTEIKKTFKKNLGSLSK